MLALAIDFKITSFLRLIDIYAESTSTTKCFYLILGTSETHTVAELQVCELKIKFQFKVIVNIKTDAIAQMGVEILF